MGGGGGHTPSLLSPWKPVVCRSCRTCFPEPSAPRRTPRAAKHTTAHNHPGRSISGGRGEEGEGHRRGRRRGEERHLLDVAYPVPDVVEGLLVGDVVHQHDALQRTQEVTSPAQEVTQVLVREPPAINRPCDSAAACCLTMAPL